MKKLPQVHDWKDCDIEDCIECQDLVDYGILMACDECDKPGLQDSEGWHLLEDGRTLCTECYQKEEEEKRKKMAEQLKRFDGVPKEVLVLAILAVEAEVEVGDTYIAKLEREKDFLQKAKEKVVKKCDKFRELTFKQIDDINDLQLRIEELESEKEQLAKTLLERSQCSSSEFTTRIVDSKSQFNTYDCKHCLKQGIKHEVISVPHGHTDRHSCWGEGIPTTRTECSFCGRWCGPWVSSDIVGGGY